MKFDWLKQSFEEHGKLWKWGAVVVADIIPSIIVVYCNQENMQRSLTQFNLLVVMTIGAGLLIAKLTDMKQRRLWLPASIIMCLLSLGLIFQIVVHFYVTRGVHVARDAEARYEREKVEADRKHDKDMADYKDASAAFDRQQQNNIQLANKNNQIVVNVSKTFGQLDRSQRSGRALPESASVTTPLSAPPSMPIRKEPPRPKMAEDVMQEAAPWFLWAGGFELVVVMLGTTIMGLLRGSVISKLASQFPALSSRLGGRAAVGNFTPHADSSADIPADTLGPSADSLPSSPKPSGGQSRNSLKTRGVNRPHADSQKVSARTPAKVSVKLSAELSGKPRRVGRNWEVLGVLLPDIPGVRYEGKPKRGSIDIRPTEGDGKSYVASLGKKDLARSKTLDQATWFQFVRDKVAAGQTRRSERAFAREGD